MKVTQNYENGTVLSGIRISKIFDSITVDEEKIILYTKYIIAKAEENY